MYVKIKEVIVVEGKNDTNVLKSYFDCDTIETYGMNIPDSVIQQIKMAQKSRGVIIFTDPDYPGEWGFQTSWYSWPGPESFCRCRPSPWWSAYRRQSREQSFRLHWRRPEQSSPHPRLLPGPHAPR